MDDPSYKSCKPNPWKTEYKNQLLLSFRKFELSQVVLFSNEFIEPIEKCILSLLNLEVSQSKSYCDYFWRIKKMLTGYMNCSHRIKNNLLLIETVIANIDQVEFNMYIIEAKNFQTSKQETFESFLDSINADSSLRDSFNELFTVYIDKLTEMEKTVESFNRMAPFLKFAMEQLEVTTKWLDDLFEFAATEMSAILYKVRKLISLSLEDNIALHSSDMARAQQRHARALETLRGAAYEARRRWVSLSRSSCSAPDEHEEVLKLIQTTQLRLQEFLMDTCFFRDELHHNRDYYVRLKASLDEILQRVDEIGNIIINSIEEIKDKTADNYDLKREEILESDNEVYKEMELTFWEKKYQKFLEEYKAQTERFQSETRTMHSDENGKFFFDEFGRKIYSGNFGMDWFCIDKDFYVQKVQNDEVYSYDCNGRLIHPSHDDTLYRRGVNNSCYRLNELDLMTKVEQEVEPTKPVAIPQLEKGQLSRQDVDYLWEALAACLPRALLQVCKAKPKNHAFLLAHRLVTCKYGPNEKQREQDTQESIKFRDEVYEKRKMATVKAYEAWQSQQMGAPAPKDISDPHAEMVHALIMEQMVATAANQLL